MKAWRNMPDMRQLAKRYHTALLVLLLSMLLATAAGQQASSFTDADLPVTRLALFTSGVGYFEHEGTVTDNQELVLSVPKTEMDDLLQSLVLQDFGGGSIEPVRYSSQAPLSRLLDAYSIDLSGNVSLLNLLAQARGERVRLIRSDDPSVIEGALLGVEEQRLADGANRAFVTVATDVGVRRIALDQLETVEFLDPALQAEINEALATIAANRDDDTATVRLRFSGTGERQVRVSYVREMPVWKSTYRLVVGEDGHGALQGWAIVDNPTDQVLEDVQLSFIAGQPVSFITSLYNPIYAVRPRVETKASGGLVPSVDTGEYLMDAMPAPSVVARAMEMAAPAAAPQMSGAGVSSQAEAAAGATSFAYHVSQAVTIGRNESALVPIVVTDITTQRVSLFNENDHPRNPLHAVRVVNDTELQLAGGTITIYDEAGFAGNARLPELMPGDERLLPYAVDLELSVRRVEGSRATNISSVRLVSGMLEVTELTRRIFTFEVEGSADRSRVLIVQGPNLDGFTIVSPTPTPPTSDGRPRFGMAMVGADSVVPEDVSVPTHLVCREGEACLLEVVAERVNAQRVALTNLDPSRVEFYLDTVELTPADRALLAEIRDIQNDATELQRSLARIEGDIAVIFREQERIRANMAAVSEGSDLYRRYVADLTQQEDTLATLRQQERQHHGDIDALWQRLNTLIGSQAN